MHFNPSQFRFDLLDAWQAGVERLGEGADELVFGDVDGFADAGERVFGDEVVAGLAEEQADGRMSSGALIWASTANGVRFCISTFPEMPAGLQIQLGEQFLDGGL